LKFMRRKTRGLEQGSMTLLLEKQPPVPRVRERGKKTTDAPFERKGRGERSSVRGGGSYPKCLPPTGEKGSSFPPGDCTLLKEGEKKQVNLN